MTNQLELSSEVLALGKQFDELKRDYNVAVSELSKCRESVGLLEEKVKSVEKVNDVLQKEVAEKQAMVNRSEERGLRLQNENLLITERVMDEKIKLMEEMNRMTEINAELRAKLIKAQQSTHSTEIDVSNVNWFQAKLEKPAPSETFHAFQAHSTEIPSIAFNEEGDKFVTGCSDGVVKVWNVESKECLHVLYSSKDSSTNAILSVHMCNNLVAGAGR